MPTLLTSPLPAPAATPQPAVAGAGLTKVYGRGPAAVPALSGVDLDIRAGQFTAIMGSSGSGKSTLLHLLAGLDVPTSGRVRIAGTDLAGLTDKALTTLRRDHVGFVFQAFNLVPTLSAAENITLPLDLAGRRVDEHWLAQVVAAVGLADRLTHRPAELSGGQRQRVAIARALITRPAVIFADEPTGALDSRSGAEVLALLRAAVADNGATVVMVTHDAAAAALADRVVMLADGLIRADLDRPSYGQVVAQVQALAEKAEA